MGMASIAFAVDKLYETGWLPDESMELERLPDGTRYPSVLAVQNAFARRGLVLTIKQNLMYKCCRAQWSPAQSTPADAETGTVSDGLHSTGAVVGNCEREAAVYSLAKLIAAPQTQTIR